MCELLGMSANVPTDICFSFSGLTERGGNIGPHTDGWGIAFCWILNKIRASELSGKKDKTKLTRYIHNLCTELSTLGVFNILLSDSKYLYSFCGKSLYWLTRKAPFGAAQLSDRNLVIDFEKETSPNDIVSVIATKPLTKNGHWEKIEPGKLIRFELGKATEF